MREVIQKVEAKIKEMMSGEGTGHDWYHVKQVRDMALRIAASEGGDKEIIELAALAHDVGDRKLHASEAAGKEVTKSVLRDCGVPPEVQTKVIDIVDRVSFKGAGVVDDMPTLEGKIVQDADRLYALGAIGIARTFAYGGSKHRPIYDPDIVPEVHATKEEYHNSKSHTINHFYEKLLLLKDRMNTKTGREIAESREQYMKDFLDQFMKEWEAKD